MLDLQLVPGHHEVNALGRAHVELPPSVRESLGVVGPDPGGVDHLLGAHLEGPAGFQVDERGAGDPLALPEEAGDLGMAGGECAVGDGGAHHGQRVPGVVHLRVRVQDRTGEGVAAQSRRFAQRLLAGQVPVMFQPTGRAGRDRHRVVQRDAAAHVGAFPVFFLQRVKELHRVHEMRGDQVEQQAALVQGLADQTEVEHLQVAQTAVDQLARPARCAARPVARFDDRRGEPAGHGVERGARPDHPAAHYEDVDLIPGHLVDHAFPVCRGQFRRHQISALP